ncbi:MAG: hypothetical protein IH831_08085 [Planctomycetes bacterium]|nr:hypothetical protein [Planctomycetota bacterium]
MANRIFVLAVVVLWLSSMSWLVMERILPSFYAGEPPMEQAYETGKAVAWQIQWKGKPVGRAASVRLSGVGGTTDLVNRVLLADIPLMELAPTWMRTVIGDLGDITFDARTRIEIDALGNFSAFNSRISINDLPSVLNISGRVEDSFLQLRIRSGDISYTTPIYLSDRNSLNEVLFPDAQLPQMYVGRSWQEKIYSPFHSPSNPVELVRAEVVSVEAIQYGEEMRKTLRIEYHTMSRSGIPQQARLQAVSWVEPSGNVLRRDVYLGGSKLRFTRLLNEAAKEVGLELLNDLIRTGAEIDIEPLDSRRRHHRP